MLDQRGVAERFLSLLFQVARRLLDCRNAVEAQHVLESFTAHRFTCLLHHYQLSNWVLYARAYGAPAPAQQLAIHELDATLRNAPVALDWLSEHWFAPAP